MYKIALTYDEGMQLIDYLTEDIWRGDKEDEFRDELYKKLTKGM